MLEELQVPSTLAGWSAGARAGGSLTAAGEHDRIWGQVVELIDQMVAAFAGDHLPLAKYRKVMESGLISLRLGLIPPGLDQVTVASLDRSRSPAIKAALLLGANDGIFPARPPEDGILTDADREALAERGIKLAPGSRRKIFDEQFLVYSALTRSSHFLYLSYGMADREGRALMPSRIIGRVRQLLPGVQEQAAFAEPAGPGEDDLGYVAGRGRTLGHLSSRLREYLSGNENHPLWWDVYNWYTGSVPDREALQTVREGLFSKNIERNITPATAAGFYGDRLRASVSRLERFNACPFSHFLAHGMKLKERLHYKLTPPDMGEIFHLALKLLAERVRRESLDWAALDRETVVGMAGEIIDSIAPRLQNEILLSTARYRYMVTRLKRRLARAAVTMAQQYRRGKFRPVGLEVWFGPREGSLPPIRLDLPGGVLMELSGRIDRIDACRWEKGQHLLVVDYKSGYKSIGLEDIYHGVNIQLPAYLDVAVANSRLLTGEDGLPGGIFYFTVVDPLIRTLGPLPSGEAEKQVLRKLRLKGLVLADRDLVKLIDSGIESSPDVIQVRLTQGGFYKNSPVVTGEQFAVMSRYLHSLYRKDGERILSGEVGIDPLKLKGYTPCSYCRYRAVCRFDPVLPENSPRIPQKLDTDQIWEKMSCAPEVKPGD
jgi:ATP-dependent helicase/nuclease subunit B